MHVCEVAYVWQCFAAPAHLQVQKALVDMENMFDLLATEPQV